MCSIVLCAANGRFSCPFCCLPNTHWCNMYEGKIERIYLRVGGLDMSKHCGPWPCPHHKQCGRAKHGTKKVNLLYDIVDLDHILIDELHCFLRLWDLVLDILLGYVEAYDREEVLERVGKMLGVNFHTMDGEDDGGYQLWTPLTGDRAKVLLDGLVRRKDLMEKLFLVGEQSVLISNDDEREKEKKEGHQLQFERTYSLFLYLSQITDFLRDGRKVLKTIEQFEQCVKKFVGVLSVGWGSVIGRVWYLHQLVAHIPVQLKRFGGSIFFGSCSAQERLNGKHTHLLLNCIQKQHSSKQLFTRSLREIYFLQHPELTHKKYTRPKRKRKREEERETGNQSTLTLDEYTQQEKRTKKKKKDRRTKVPIE